MIQTFESNKDGFNVVMQSTGWQIAILHPGEKDYRGPLKKLAKHMTTDEVFVLVSGSGTLFTVDDGKLVVIAMEIGKVYNVPRGEWHSLVLSDDATAVVAEDSTLPAGSTISAELTELLK